MSSTQEARGTFGKIRHYHARASGSGTYSVACMPHVALSEAQHTSAAHMYRHLLAAP